MDVITIVVTAALTSTTGAIVGGAVGWIRAREATIKEDKEEQLQTMALTLKVLKALTKDSYFRFCRYLVSQEDIKESEYDNYEDLRACYKALNMNGKGDWYHQQIQQKSIKPDK